MLMESAWLIDALAPPPHHTTHTPPPTLPPPLQVRPPPPVPCGFYPSCPSQAASGTGRRGPLQHLPGAAASAPAVRPARAGPAVPARQAVSAEPAGY